MSKLKAHDKFKRGCFQLNVILKKIGQTLNQYENKNYHYDELTVNIIYTEFIVD